MNPCEEQLSKNDQYISLLSTLNNKCKNDGLTGIFQIVRDKLEDLFIGSCHAYKSKNRGLFRTVLSIYEGVFCENN